jgi:hypothetical protein
MRKFALGFAVGIGIGAVPVLAVPEDILLTDWVVGKNGVVVCKGIAIRERLKTIDCLP